MKRLVVALTLAAVNFGCSGFGGDKSVLELSSAEALEQGKALLAEEEYRQARSYLIHAFEIEPNSVNGREGLLLAADSMFLAGGYGNYVKAQARYRDFLNRFPTSDKAAYAQLQLGLSIARRMERPDRDMSISAEALGAFEDVQRFYPTSEYAELAAAEAVQVRYHLARHELIVARFYMRYQRYGTAFAAIDRMEKILEDFPTFPETDAVLFYLCRAYSTSDTEELQEKARKTCFRLKTQYPESKYIKKLPKNLGSVSDEQGVDTVVPADGGV
jgi:outer membrane protein assembly factor BamD